MRWLILIVLFVARTTMGFQFQSVASAAPFLVDDLHLSYADVGSLIGLYLLPGIFLALPSAFLQVRFGDKAICLLGLLLMAIGGAVLGFSGDYTTALVGRICSGVGAVLLNLVVLKMVTDWFAGREIAFAMAAIAASWGVGIAVGLLVQGPIASSVGWHSLMHIIAALSGFSLVIVLAFYRSPPLGHEKGKASQASPHYGMPSLHNAAACLVAGAVWGVFNAGLVNFFSFTPVFLATRGLTLVEASSLTSLTLWISVFSIPVSGYFVHWSGKPNLAIWLFSFITGLVLLTLAINPSMALFLCIIVGLVLAPPVGAILALPARVLTPEQRSVGLGIFYTCYYALTTLGAPIAGMLRDLTANAAVPVIFGAALFAFVPALLAAFLALTTETPSRR
jgi:predicted MFS family arabinose efflux permease